MRHRISLALFLAVLLTLLPGCRAIPATPEAAAEAARAFMEARVGGDAAAVESMLTARARKEITRSQISLYLNEASTGYGGLGSPSPMEPGVVRIPVRDLTLTGRERSTRWPESWLTLRYEGDRWRVAWAEPLFNLAAQAYQNDRLVDELRYGHAIAAIDPYHYRGYLEQHFALRDLKRYRLAEVAINNALERAMPAQRPDVHDAMARFMLQVNAPAQALTHARQALDLAAPHTPDTYSTRWQADTLVVAARAALGLGDRTTAEALASQAAALDPQNAELAIFRHQLVATPPPPPGGR
ncbi:MAG: hypothetical protein ACOY94_15800 [Bacillota bacterium]